MSWPGPTLSSVDRFLTSLILSCNNKKKHDHFLYRIQPMLLGSDSSMSLSPCLHVSGFRKQKMELTENGIFRLFSAMENRTGKLPFVFCKRKQEKEVRFFWSANDKRQSTIAVSTNVHINGTTYSKIKYL
jgi:hypothetical protein